MRDRRRRDRRRVGRRDAGVCGDLALEERDRFHELRIVVGITGPNLRTLRNHRFDLRQDGYGAGDKRPANNPRSDLLNAGWKHRTQVIKRQRA